MKRLRITLVVALVTAMFAAGVFRSKVWAQSAPPISTSLPAKPPQLGTAEEIPKAQFAEEKNTKPAPPPANAVNGPLPSVAGPPEPFGSRLFTGNFSRTRQDGLNADYVVMPGDRVQVNTWGAIESSTVYLGDAQGNIFLPNVGPIQVAGTKNSELTLKVRTGLTRVYARNFEVYTNLLSAKPVAVFVTGGVNRPGRYAGVPSDSV